MHHHDIGAVDDPHRQLPLEVAVEAEITLEEVPIRSAVPVLIDPLELLALPAELEVDGHPVRHDHRRVPLVHHLALLIGAAVAFGLPEGPPVIAGCVDAELGLALAAGGPAAQLDGGLVENRTCSAGQALRQVTLLPSGYCPLGDVANWGYDRHV